MKNLALLSLVCLALFQPVVEAIFLGPIAVGAVIGALAVGKGFILGSLLSQKRTRRQSYRQPRTYHKYNKKNHYHQQDAYYKHYTKRQTYYYSSDDYYYRRGKRFAPEIDLAELERYKREVVDKIMTDEWYMDMVEKDQDDCTKRLICEISHKKANGKVLKTIEEDIVNIFGEGLSVDTSKTTAVFDFAAQAGKYWKKGGIGCEFFRRCETPIDDIVAMIENEIEDFRDLEKSFAGSKANAVKQMDEEQLEVDNMIKSLEV